MIILGPFFKGAMSMHWGVFKSGPASGTVYFTGETDATVVGLGGSSQHLIGGAGEPQPGLLPSASPLMSILPALDDELHAEEEAMQRLEWMTSVPEWAEWVEHIAKTRRGLTVTTDVEFIARRLAYSPPGAGVTKCVLLGSPIYVAAAD